MRSSSGPAALAGPAGAPCCRPGLFGVVVALALSVGPGSAAVADGGSGVCRVHELRPEGPGWISSAVWVAARSALLVVDPREDRLLLYTPTGERVGEMAAPGGLGLSGIEPVDGGFVVKLVGRRTLGLGADLTPDPEGGLELERGAAAGLGSLDSWALGHGQLVAYGTVLDAEGGGVRSGFLAARVVEGVPSAAHLVLPLASEYSGLGWRWVSLQGTAAYLLVLDETPRVVELAHGGRLRALRAFPAEFRRLPSLGRALVGPAGTEARLRELEGLALPLEIFGRGGFLYLLTRKPAPGGQTEWQLHQIDPGADAVTGAVRLPTSAPHLTLVPGEGTWFVVERGRVGPGGAQEIATLVAVPSAWIESPGTSPLALPSPRVLTCRRAHRAQGSRGAPTPSQHPPLPTVRYRGAWGWSGWQPRPAPPRPAAFRGATGSHPRPAANPASIFASGGVPVRGPALLTDRRAEDAP